MSAAGKRAGIKAGTRSGLWSVFADAIDALRPRWVVIENVRGLLSATAERAVESGEDAVGDRAGRPVLRAAGAVLGDLADLGYDAQWATVAAADVGAPHRRERVFIIAENTQRLGLAGPERQAISGRTSTFSGGSSCCVSEVDAVSGEELGVALLPTPRNTDGERGPSAESGGMRPSGHPRQKDLNTVTAREFLHDGRGLEPDQVVVGQDDGAVPVFPGDGGGDDTVLVALNGDGVAVDVGSGEKSHSACVAGELAGTKHEPGVALLPTPRSSDCFGAGHHGDGGMDLRTTVTERADTTAWGKYEPAIRRWEAVTGQPAPTPTEPNKNGNPRLSAAFSEWLMGWPAGWVTDPAIGISRNDQLRCVGNGVVPQQAEVAISHLLAISELVPSQ